MKLHDKGLLRNASYIAGVWQEAGAGSLKVTNPATGESIAEVVTAGREQTEAAIAAAHDAMQSWQEVPAKARAQVLRRWFDLMMSHQEDLAIIMTTEQGKALAESRGEVAYGAAFMEWFGEQAKRIDGDVIPAPSSDKRVVCIKLPGRRCRRDHAVEFPQCHDCAEGRTSARRRVQHCDQAGIETPLSALAMAELAERAGVPAGVLNVVVRASSEIGPALADSPLVRKLTFTGSTGWDAAWSRLVPRRSSGLPWSWAATRRLLSLTTLISIPRCRAPDLEVPRQQPNLCVH